MIHQRYRVQTDGRTDDMR